MKRSEKNDFVKKLKDDFEKSSTIIVSHYSGLSVLETDELRKVMRSNGTYFKVTKNRLTKLALQNSQFESIADLFKGPTAVAYSSDPIAPARVAVEFEKKFENFNILGGFFEGEKVAQDKIKFLASLPSLDEVRSKLAMLLVAPAQKVASVIQAPAGQLARLIQAKIKDNEKT